MDLYPNLPVWDDAPWPALPRLEGTVEADVCVVGLGGSGLACVGEALARGASVVGLDAARVASGAAGRNGGFLLAGIASFHHDAAETIGRARATRLYRLTLAELDRLAAETPEFVRRDGSLRIAASPAEHDDCARMHEAMRADGLPVERYAGPEGEGLLFPHDGVMQPLARCRALARDRLARGARLFEDSRALRLGDGLVETAHGAVRCRHVIVAVDGSLERLVPALMSRVRTARLQMLATAPLAERRFPRPVYRRWGYDYWQQLPDGRLVLGGFRDVAEEAEWTHAADPTAEVQAHAERFVRESLGIDAPITHRWAASVAYTRTRLPIIERLASGAWVAGAYSGTGNVVGALCGRALAELALTGRSAIADAFREA